MTSIDESDRLTFWRNWYEAIKFKPPQERLEKYDALLAYAFDGVEPDRPTAEHPESANAYEIVSFIRAAIAKSRAQRQNGAKPKRSQTKRTRSRSEAKRSGREAEAEQEQEQVQEQEQEQEQDANSLNATSSAPRRGRKPPTLSQFVGAGRTAGIDPGFCREFYAELESNGWMDSDGLPVGNWRMYLKAAFLNHKKNSAPRALAPHEAFDAAAVPVEEL